MEFTYRDVVETFRIKHEIDPGRKSAFKGRLQHFQRQGFPPGVNTGKGKAASYRWRELILLGLALEYAEIGSTPDRSIKEVSKFSDMLVLAVARSLNAGDVAEEERPSFLCIELSALLPLKTEDNWNQEIKLLSIREMNEVFSELGVATMQSPYAIIDLRQFIAGLLTSLEQVVAWSRVDLVKGLKQWARTIVDFQDNIDA